MQFDFLFPVLYSDQDIAYYDALARALEERGHTVALLALSRVGAQRLSENHRHVFFLYEGWDGRGPAIADQRAIERAYGITLIDHVFPEHLYPWGRPLDELARRAAFTFRYLEQFNQRHQVEMVVNNYGGEVVRRCAARIADVGGPTNVFLDAAPFPGRVSATTSEWDWDDLPHPLPAIDAAQRRLAEAQVEHAVREKPSVARGGGKVRLGFDSLRWSTQNILRALRSTERLDYSVARAHVDRAVQIARSVSHRALPWSQPSRADEPYIFFPLHVPADSAISVRAPQFQRQDAVVEYLATRGVPAGMKLYVKPHPDGLYFYSAGTLARMARLPNTKLIHPSVRAHDLIARAEAMVVINSSVGIESLYYQKPVVVLGRVFYRGFGLTIDLDDLTGIAAAVLRALEWKPDREGILRFFTATTAATAPGRFQDTSPENLALLSSVLERKGVRLADRRRAQVSAT
jgi:hypothetical protein